MNVLVIGGGPAGLATAISLKGRWREWTIELRERRTSVAATGCGLILTPKTVDAVETLLADSPGAFRAVLKSWSSVCVVRGTDSARSRCAARLATSRAGLLWWLLSRALDIGVEVHFDASVGEPRAALAQYDLLVAADGLHSPTRESFHSQFNPSRHQGGTLYAWFRTALPLDCLTFFFELWKGSGFVAHAYPHEDGETTFIVDAPTKAWLSAGFADPCDDSDTAVEGVTEFCETVFSHHLTDHSLTCESARLEPTITLRTERTIHRNVVLVGDAARTSDFSIGRGTEEALRDASTLKHALERAGTISSALELYGGARERRRKTLEVAGNASRRWFADVHRLEHMGVDDVLASLLMRGRTRSEMDPWQTSRNCRSTE